MTIETPATPAAETTPSPAAPAAPAPSATPPPTAPDWTSSFNDETKGYVSNKGFKDPGMLLDSYRNLEKLVGTPAEKIIKLPENLEDPKAFGEIMARLGRPATVDGYKIEATKENEAFAKWAKGLFFESGLTGSQAKSMFDGWSKYAADILKTENEKREADLSKETESLKGKWGAAYEQNVNLAKRAMSEFGIKPELLDKIESMVGYSEVMELMQSIGSKVGEARYISPETRPNFGGIMTPDAAKNEIARLKTDSGFVEKYTSGDAESIRKMNQLHQWAYPSP